MLAVAAYPLSCAHEDRCRLLYYKDYKDMARLLYIICSAYQVRILIDWKHERWGDIFKRRSAK